MNRKKLKDLLKTEPRLLEMRPALNGNGSGRKALSGGDAVVGQTLFLGRKCLITGNVRGTVLGTEPGTGPNRGNERT